tara:strand:+ start:505 stop:684 length:180 start_codon:yes stop_codon:yes gene_type:complete
MFKEGQEVTVNAMGASNKGVVLSNTKGDSTRVKVHYQDVLKGTTATIAMNFDNRMIKLR